MTATSLWMNTTVSIRSSSNYGMVPKCCKWHLIGSASLTPSPFLKWLSPPSPGPLASLTSREAHQPQDRLLSSPQCSRKPRLCGSNFRHAILHAGVHVDLGKEGVWQMAQQTKNQGDCLGLPEDCLVLKGLFEEQTEFSLWDQVTITSASKDQNT